MGSFESIIGFLKQLRKLLAPFEFVGKKFAILVNAILLSVVYFTAFAATAIIAKILRKSFLDLKVDGRKSYWIDRKKEDYSKKENYRSF